MEIEWEEGLMGKDGDPRFRGGAKAQAAGVRASIVTVKR